MNIQLGNRNEGWICAKCGRSYAPFVHECRDCNGRKSVGGTDVTPDPQVGASAGEINLPKRWPNDITSNLVWPYSWEVTPWGGYWK